MYIWALCIFCVIPFHHAAVHEVETSFCPDYASILRFENQLNHCKIQNSQPVSVPEPASVPVPKNASTDRTAGNEKRAENMTQVSELTPEVVPPAALEIASISENKNQEAVTPIPVQNSGKSVRFASAEEPAPSDAPSTGNGGSTDPQNVHSSENVPTTATLGTPPPIQRPWGVLTFFVFLLLLSLSANVFLGWQLVETYRQNGNQ